MEEIKQYIKCPASYILLKKDSEKVSQITFSQAKQNLVKFHTRKPRRKASDIKEYIAKMRPLLREASIEQQYRMLKLLKEFSAVPSYAASPTVESFIEDTKGVEEGKKRKKKKTSRSLSRYFFPGYGYYGSGESGDSGGDSGGDGGGGEGVAEGVPQPGASSGAPKQFGPDAKIQTKQMTVKEIIASIPGLPYYNNVVDDYDAKDYSWGVTQKVMEYATYLKQHPESLAKLPPILVLNGKFEDGAHRVSAVWLLQQRMDPKNPLWANAKLNVQFVKQGVAEGELDKFKKYTRPVVKTTPKIERTTNPAGRTTDHVEWIVTSDTGEKRRFTSKKAAQEFHAMCTQGVDEGWLKNTAAGLALGAAALGGAQAGTTTDDPSWSQGNYASHVKSDQNIQQQTGSPSSRQSRISDVTGPNADGEYKVTVTQNGKLASQYVTKTPPANWMVKEQGVSEKMKMGATIEPMEDKEEIDPVKTVIQFYEPIVNDIRKEKIDDYVDKARELLHKTDDPSIRTKLIDIFKKGKDNPYIQGGIITTVGALLAGGLLSSANKMGLSPSQTNILLQSVLNTVIPTIVSRINGKSWADTIKYTLASAGIGTSIAALTEKESDVIGHVAKDLSSDGAPIAKLRVARDKEQMKKRERSDGLPVEPKFDYLDEK
jgi:hypothetical protein